MKLDFTCSYVQFKHLCFAFSALHSDCSFILKFILDVGIRMCDNVTSPKGAPSDLSTPEFAQLPSRNFQPGYSSWLSMKGEDLFLVTDKNGLLDISLAAYQVLANDP